MTGSGHGNRKHKVSSTRVVENNRVVTRVLAAALKVADRAYSVAAFRSWNRLPTIGPQERVFDSHPLP